MAGPQLDMSRPFAGRYSIERQVGRGSTATVYLASDSKGDRKVAIKMLRPELANSMASERFVREIKLTASLSHAHILPVLDAGDDNKRLYFALPYMEGGSLRDRLLREKQLPLPEAVRIGAIVADALAHAHDHKLIHRDVKPENILFAGGTPHLADFGIARALAHALGVPDDSTSTGVVRGTLAYMSPEQASGSSDYDGRSDIYGLGCVLYEMIAGVQAFHGATPEAVLAQRFSQRPRELQAYRDTASDELCAVVMKALEFSPADRFASAAAMSAALRELEVNNRITAPRRPRRRMVLAVAGASAIVAVAAIATMTAIKRGAVAEPASVVTFVVPPPTGAQFTDDLRDVSAVSPDGRDIIIAGTDSAGVRGLWLRHLADRAAQRIQGTESGSEAFWSPDGKTLGFYRGRSLAVIDRAGGTSRTLADASTSPRGGTFLDNATILFAPSSQSGIYSISLSNGTAKQITRPSAARGEIGHVWPQALHDGKQFLYFVASDVDSVRGIYFASVDVPKGRRLVGSSASAMYSNGHLLFMQNGALVAQAFDPTSGTLSGKVRHVADSVATSFEYYAAFSASRSGVLVYAGGRSRDISRLTWMDTSGANRGFATPDGYWRNPDLSPDGRYLAFETYRETDSDIRYLDLTSDVSTLLADSGLQATDPVWSPDASAIAFVAERPGAWNVYRKYVNRSDAPELLYSSPRYTVLTDWTADGSLVLNERNEAGDFDLVSRALSALTTPVVIAGGASHQVAGRVSVDGKFIVYVSLESGQPQVYAQAFPAGPRCQLSATGGHQAVWGRAAGEVFYLSSNGSVMRVTVDLSRAAPCPVGAPRALLQSGVRNPSRARSFFDVSPSDGRLLINAPSAQDGAWLTVILNWLAVLPPA
jgi:Tol biopolymer transport system component/tRNA A-37 threonylcarbamoyl transferase component Bud32